MVHAANLKEMVGWNSANTSLSVASPTTYQQTRRMAVLAAISGKLNRDKRFLENLFCSGVRSSNLASGVLLPCDIFNKTVLASSILSLTNSQLGDSGTLLTTTVKMM